MDDGMSRILEAGDVRYSERRVVRFQEVDAAGIVFFARIFDYFHDAYVGFLRERGAPLEGAIRDGSWGAPLRDAHAEFLRPLRFGDEIRVAVVDIALEETEYTVSYRIDLGGEAVCAGRTRHVAVDPETFRRTRLPDLLRRALEPSD